MAIATCAADKSLELTEPLQQPAAGNAGIPAALPLRCSEGLGALDRGAMLVGRAGTRGVELRRVWTSAVVAFSVAVCGLVAATPAAAIGVSLPIPHYADMLVDEAHGHLFFTAGAGSSSVWVTDLTGHSVATLASLGGATGLAMSADGTTVYVAEAGANAIAGIDTTSLAVSSVLADAPCATWLAYAAARLWYSYGCDNNGGAVASFDPTASPITTSALPSPGVSYISPPHLAAGGPTASVLIVTSGQYVYSYDVSTAPGQETASNGSDCPGTYGGVAVTPDGASVVVACGYPNNVVTLAKTSDLSTIATYAAGRDYAAKGISDPAAVAFSADGQFLSLGISELTPDIVTFPTGDTSAPNFTASTGVAYNWLARDGLRYGPSGNLYAVVPTTTQETAYTLVVYKDTTKYPSVTALSAPTSAPRAQPLTLTGHISGRGPAIAGGQSVTVRRTDLAGTKTLAGATTADDGTFQIVDTPPVGGTVTYTASWAGDDARRGSTSTAKVNVSRIAPTLTIGVNSTNFPYGGKAIVTAHLGPTYNSRKVTLYAVPYGSTRRNLVTANVDSHGNLQTSVNVYARISFGVAFAGDYRYAPKAVSRSVAVHGKLVSWITGYYGRSGAYYLLRHSADAQFKAQLSPAWSSLPLTFGVQSYYAGAWHLVGSTYVVTYGGFAERTFEPSHVAGALYRLRAGWGGNYSLASATSNWVYIRLT